MSNDVSEKIYYAPELICPHLNLPLHGDKIDVFALGVIIFVAMFGEAPFNIASPNADPYYRLFCKDRQEFEKFFKVHRTLRRSQFVVDSDLKDLLFSMLQVDPNQRPTITQALNSKWA